MKLQFLPITHQIEFLLLSELLISTALQGAQKPSKNCYIHCNFLKKVPQNQTLYYIYFTLQFLHYIWQPYIVAAVK